MCGAGSKVSIAWTVAENIPTLFCELGGACVGLRLTGEKHSGWRWLSPPLQVDNPSQQGTSLPIQE